MAYACETGKTYGFTDVFELHIKRLRYFINKTHEINTNEHLCLDNPEKKNIFDTIFRCLQIVTSYICILYISRVYLL